MCIRDSHCIDEASDLVTYEKNGVLDYLLEMKRSGVVHHLGLSSHTPALVEEMLDRKFIDVVMFSVNPIYDYGKGDYGIGGSEERNACLLYTSGLCGLIRRNAKNLTGI